MKKLLITGVVVSVIVSGLYAKRNFEQIKEYEINKLEKKEQLIKNRKECIKNAKSTKEISICKKENPLVERKKR